MTADEALAWVMRYARSMSVVGTEVTFEEVYPLDEQAVPLLDALAQHRVFDTPMGPRVIVEVRATDGPEGWTFVLDEHRVGVAR